ncbi:MAG: Zn-ribbon domain-containing OB-fold protein [Anaerolineales bacterium]|nr:MAG: Zn-ribbon domain-containing OB-fold protein [Anaerolineales bacterium]
MTSKIKVFPGTPLREVDFKEGKILYRHDEMNGQYAWDTGIGIGSYLAALKEGVLLGSYCRSCRRTVVPPRTVCEWCFRPMNSYAPLKNTGTVNTFSLCYITWDLKRIKEPEISAVIEIDGASPLHGIMHKLGEVDPEDVHIGMRVQAVWKPADEREGAITDILYFKPIKEG